jgi:hypothetical protein
MEKQFFLQHSSGEDRRNMSMETNSSCNIVQGKIEEI